MAEQAIKREPKPETVYVGQGKPDTEYNRRMQEVFDVVSKEAVIEREDARNTQAELALLTASELTNKKTLWEKDESIRGRKLPRKLERVLYLSVLAGSSALMDYAGNTLSDRVFTNENPGVWFRGKPILPFNKENGNREAMKAGWEFVTDELIGEFSNISVQQATNTSDIRFVSPLSDMLSKVGSIALKLTIPQRQLLKSLVNPSSVEAGIRLLATVPVGGAVVERAYAAGNQFLMKENRFFSFGFDLAATMLAVKAKHKNANQTV